MTLKTFAPDVKTGATTVEASADSTSYTMSISTSDTIPINITPTSSQAIYTATNAISYTNTCPFGFGVTMSAATAETSLTRIGSDSNTKTIPTITSGTSLTDNSWGYSLDNGATFNAVPALGSPASIIDTSSANATAATLNLQFGVKTDNTLPSGSYNNDVVYTVVVKPTCLTYEITWDLDGGTAAAGATYPDALNFGGELDLSALTPTKTGYILSGWSNGTDDFDGTETNADINPNNLPSVTMTAIWEEDIDPMQNFNTLSLANGESTRLKDLRDGEAYNVRKLSDGNVWMTQNLRISNREISSGDSNLPSGTTWTIPASSATGFSAQNENNVYVDENYGGYYTFYAATAGWGTNTVTSGDAPRDICPKGWRLATRTDYNNLINKYNSATLMQGDPGFVYSGRVISSGTQTNVNLGYYWTATVGNANYAYRLYMNTSSANAGSSIAKYEGYAVRCVAKKMTMQNFNMSMLPNYGSTATLTDARDGKEYSVKKLPDGKVWMTNDLNIVDSTITSEDSNLPEGTTFTIPASSMSGFSSSNTNNAYSSGTGSYSSGYYTFYTATAGWGTSDKASGNSPQDICPKGWHLPNKRDYNTIAGFYNLGNGNFSKSGYISYGTLQGTINTDDESIGKYWTSSIDGGAGRAASFYVGGSEYDYIGAASWDGNSASNGYNVRCVADVSGTMQSFDINNLEYGRLIFLEDERDGNVYSARRLLDGRIWMIDDLRIINKTISDNDSDLPDNTTFTIPSSSQQSITSNSNGAYLGSGGLYTHNIATAWTLLNIYSGNEIAEGSICPKGWKLPSGGTGGEFETLYGFYNSSSLMMNEPNFKLVGMVSDAVGYYSGTYGFYWSSVGLKVLRVGRNDIDVDYTGSEYEGYSIRCVARTP